MSVVKKKKKISRRLGSEQRILLNNTPLQNTLKELWTMIHFLLPGITRPYADFPVKAGTDQNQDYCHKLVIRLHRVSVGPAGPPVRCRRYDDDDDLLLLLCSSR